MKISPFILKALDLKPEEGPKFMLLFFHSFFLGLFIAFYFAPANSMFIHHFGTEQLPLAYMAAGFAGYSITMVYSSLQKRVSSRTLFLSALILMFVIPLLSRLGLSFFSEKWLSFFVFIWGWPFISLTAIESGGLVIRFLNLRQVKRLFGLINMGGVIASIFGYLAIPLFMNVFKSAHAYDLFFIGCGGIIISIVLLFVIFNRFGEKTKKEDGGGNKVINKKFKDLIKEKYFSLIFLSATLSMTVIYFSDFAFLASIKAQSHLIDTPEKVSNFIAIVFGGLKIGELIISYYSSRILSKYGVKLGLTILPVASTILILVATIFGLISGVASMFFFVFIVMNKAFERILRRGLDDPSFNILYQPLPDEQKLSIQTRVGVIMQLAIGIAGAFLWVAKEVLRTPDGFNLEYFTLFFLPILGVWTFITTRVYRQYKERIRIVLAERDKKKKKNKFTDIYGYDLLYKHLNNKSLENVRMSVTILSEANPKTLELNAIKLLNSDDPTIIKSILRNIDPTWSLDTKSAVDRIYKNFEHEEIHKLAGKVLEHYNFTGIEGLTLEDADRLASSVDIADKLMAIKYLRTYISPSDDSIVIKLLKSNRRIVTQAAVSLAGQRNTTTLNKELISFLHSTQYMNIIADTLINAGEDVVKDLEDSFTEKTPSRVLIKLAEIYAKIGSETTKSLMVNHLSFPDKEVQVAVVNGLYYCGYQAQDKDALIIKQKIGELVENILWIFVTINDIESQKNTLKLIQALDLEREENFELLFKLLSFIYQPVTIDLIKTNIIGENTIFALELIENFINQDIKQLIIPLFDRISVSQRMRKLHNYFPMQKLKFADRLKDIILVDYHRIDLWTKDKAIELLGKLHKRTKTTKTSTKSIKDTVMIWTREQATDILHAIRRTELPDEMFVCLYHPDELIYSTAAKIIFDEDPVTCVNYLKNLSSNKQQLISALESEVSNLLLERAKFLKRIHVFFRISENTLVKLAKVFMAAQLKKGNTVALTQNGSENIYILLKGKVVYKKPDGEEIKFSRNEIVVKGVNVEEDAKELTAKSKSVVLCGNRHEYFNLLYNQTEIVQYMFERKQTKKSM